MYGIFKLLLIILISFSSGKITLNREITEDGKPKSFLREYSLVKPYQGFFSNNWNIKGNAIITSDYIRLTEDRPSLQGSIWSLIPCYVKYWEVHIHFKVHGHGTNVFGDGFAFWYVKEPMQEGNVFGSKDFFNGLAILADTYSNHNGEHNHQHPYLSAMVNNGTSHYDHDRDGTHTQLAGCTAKFRNKEHDTHMAVVYDKDTLSVFTDIDGKGEYKECFTVNGVILPTGYFFGVSAITGGVSDNHDIVSLRLADRTDASAADASDRSKVSPSASYFEAPRDHIDDPKPSVLSGWKKVLLLIFGVCAICGCVFIGGLFYQQQQEQKRKRFY